MYEPANDITCFFCRCCCYCWVKCGRALARRKNWHALSDFKTTQIHSKTIYPHLTQTSNLWRSLFHFHSHHFCCETLSRSQMDGDFFSSSHRHFIAIDVNAFTCMLAHTPSHTHFIPLKILYWLFYVYHSRKFIVSLTISAHKHTHSLSLSCSVWFDSDVWTKWRKKMWYSLWKFFLSNKHITHGQKFR